MIHQPRMLRAAILAGLIAGAASIAVAQQGFSFGPVATTTITGATGTISQVNYNESGGAVESFLLSTNVILSFPSVVCAGVASLGIAGNSVTYSGTAVTFSSGIQSVNVTSFTNNTTKASYTKPTPAKPSAYPATSGVINQLNYGIEGYVNGFLFTPAGGTSKVFVDISPRPNATLASLLKVGTAVTVAGILEPAPACAPSGTVTQVDVDASTLTFGSTTITFGSGFGFGH